MGRPKEIENGVRISTVIPKEQLDWMKKMALKMSTNEGRQITVSEAIRMAIEVAYPVPKNQPDFLDHIHD